MKLENQSLVSVGVPTYNRPVTLKRAIDSLIKQSYANLEIIVSDNCSIGDDVENVMKSFEFDKRIKFIKQSVNKGIVNNFNVVLQQATGSFFMWLADDDWLDLNYISECVSFLTAHPDYSAAYGVGKMYSTDQTFVSYDVRIDLTQDSGTERLKSYLKNLQYNACFSALIPIQLRPHLIMKDLIAIDWLIVCRIAFQAKYKMLETTSKHISKGGVSASIDSLTKSMPAFTQSFPSFMIAVNVFKDIVWYSPAYKKLGVLQRLILARDCFSIISKKLSIKSHLKSGMKKYFDHKRTSI